MKQVITACFGFYVLLAACQKPEVASLNKAEREPTPAARPSSGGGDVQVTAICDYDYNETTLTGWTKVFEDDFNGDLSKWNIWNGGAFNNELQHYQASNASVANGNLVIAVKKETVTGATTPYDNTQKTFEYTSSRLECKSNVSAGAQSPKVRMVARIKLPAGYGMWPAFWSYGDPWPTQGEIDFLEARGQEPTRYHTNYFYGKTAGRNLVRGQEGHFNANQDLQQCYHVYEMIWAQNTLTSYLDGKQIEQKSGGYIPNMFGKTQRITLNVAVGGGFFGSNFNPALISPGTMYVDYVRVYTAQ